MSEKNTKPDVQLDFTPKTREMFARCEIDDPDQARGATEAEIADMEELLHVTLPTAYREFLLYAGMFEMDGPFVGSDCFLQHLPSLQAWFLEYMAGNPVLHNHEGNWFAFYCHQGYDWAWFYLDDGDNPTVYQYDETMHSSVQKIAKLDDFFTK